MTLRFFKNWLAAPLFILVGVLVAAVLFLTKSRDARSEVERKVPLVEVVAPEMGTFSARIPTTGVVEPSQQIVVMPQVSGAIVYVSEELVPGGRASRGTALARVDPRDYELAIDQETSRVRQAELDLQLELGRQDIAEREWQLLGGEGEPDLALRRPHLASAEQALASARGSLERAELALSRTALRAPFDAVVLSESVDVGQVVGPSSQVAVLAGTDAAWLRVPVAVEDLARIEIPGARAEIVQTYAGAEHLREGRVIRLEGQLDAASRTATLLVEVPEPLDPPGGGLPLLFGSFVEVIVEGVEVEVARVPRGAVEDGIATVADAEDQLQLREVQRGWTDEDDAYLLGGLVQGDRVVVSSLRFPVEGMALRIEEAK